MPWPGTDPTTSNLSRADRSPELRANLGGCAILRYVDEFALVVRRIVKANWSERKDVNRRAQGEIGSGCAEKKKAAPEMSDGVIGKVHSEIARPLRMTVERRSPPTRTQTGRDIHGEGIRNAMRAAAREGNSRQIARPQ